MSVYLRIFEGRQWTDLHTEFERVPSQVIN